MIAALGKSLDRVLGRGEAAVTVPPLDGALRPNHRLDSARLRMPLDDVDDLVAVDAGIWASSGPTIYRLTKRNAWKPHATFPCRIACMAGMDQGVLAVGLESGEIVIEGGPQHGRTFTISRDVRHLTAICTSGMHLYAANGSDGVAFGDWQRDLLKRNETGSLWRLSLDSGESTRLAGGLAYPAGVIGEDGSLIVSEAWKHRLVRIGNSGSGNASPLLTDLPAYPGRITRAAHGYWLSMFAPRSQIVEFVLRERAYCERMMQEVPQPYWIAPKQRAGRSFYEPLQAGGVKHLGILKPWAPTLSAGLCVRLDEHLNMTSSLHSRADGDTHGITSTVERGDMVYAASRGNGVVVAISPSNDGGAA